jgi:tetratricopeptide (TPR) repeat protein
MTPISASWVSRIFITDKSGQHNLSLTHFFLAGALFEQGALDEALDNYRQSLAISQHLASTDALNTGWQGDLADIYFAIGNALRTQGQLSNALKNYRASIASARSNLRSASSSLRLRR